MRKYHHYLWLEMVGRNLRGLSCAVPPVDVAALHCSEKINTSYCYTNKDVSRLMRKPTICICENKDADQLRGNSEADQRLCFHYSDSTIPLLLKSEISSSYLRSVLVQVGLCRTCSETTLLVFPRGGSCITSNNYIIRAVFDHLRTSCQKRSRFTCFINK